MATSTFDGPVVSLGGFQSYGPNVIPTQLTASATLTRDAYAGKLILVAAAAGLTLTLPTIVTTANTASSGPGNDPNTANNVGSVYTFLFTAPVTSNSYVILCGGSDIMIGTAQMASSSAPLSAGFAAIAASAFVKVTMNGSTTGGLAGTYIQAIAIAANRYFVTVLSNGTGTSATPFSV